MSRAADSAGRRARVPAAETPADRSQEQDLAAGRTAGTPVAVLATVIGIVAVAVLVVGALVVLGYALA